MKSYFLPDFSSSYGTPWGIWAKGLRGGKFSIMRWDYLFLQKSMLQNPQVFIDHLQRWYGRGIGARWSWVQILALSLAKS